MYVKNRPESFDEAQLTDLFASVGEVANVHLVVDEEGKSRGFGFVHFVNAEDAPRAIQVLHDSHLEGKTLWVGRAQKKTERERALREMFEKAKRDKAATYESATNVYVKNLADDVTDEVLRAEFGRFGDIASAKVMYDPEDATRSRGFGFVRFSTADAATLAAAEMNSKMLNGKPLYVAVALRREERRAQLEAQFARLKYTGIGTPFSMGAMGGRVALPPDVEQLSPEDQKQIIGERLFTQISATQPAQAAQITGMLLEMDNAELLFLLESPPHLAAKVEDALLLLQEHGGLS